MSILNVVCRNSDLSEPIVISASILALSLFPVNEEVFVRVAQEDE